MQYPVYISKFSPNIQKYVNACLDETRISSWGKIINKFESTFTNYLSFNYATLFNNRTDALHLYLFSLNLAEIDEVTVPTLTYIASDNAIKYVGREPIFVDS